MRSARRAYARRVGYRGTGLLVLACAFWAYGAAMILGYKPIYISGVDRELFGWAWLAVGAVVVTGVLARVDRAQYAVACAAMACWAGLRIVTWERTHSWAAGISWLTSCLLALGMSSWPEPPDADRSDRP